MSIKLLSKQVINQISAGEVVEKPASVVKELVENSIDAKATQITIEIKSGGIDYIAVTDNGCGIKKDEIQLAFMPHATSKLTDINDLNTLDTMGFRGEALATISAVSKVGMTTKTKEQETGVFVRLDGGEQVDFQEVACVTGTKIEVSNLFYNTPARLKFLRKPKSEENDITNFVEKLMLANINISFKYIVDNKIIYNTTAGNLLDVLYAIYGKEIAENLLEVNYSNASYSVKGYISKPLIAKSNRTYQSLFVNTRFCNNSLISSAVSNAYENFSMKGKFPVYVLFLEMPKNEVDVNVHPNKLEVKFENSRIIYGLFYEAITEALANYNHINKITFEKQEDTQIIEKIEPQIFLKENEGVSQSNNYDSKKQEYSDEMINSKNNTGSYDFNLTESILSQSKIKQEQEKYDTLQEVNLDIEEETPELIEQNEITNIPIQEDFKQILSVDYRIVGKTFNTYLILECQDKLYFIDQHAAHERQKYDEIINQLNQNSLKVQDLLMPYTFKVNTQECNFLIDNLQSLNDFGIDICEFGYNTFKISSVPLILADINLKEYFDDILNNLTSFTKSPREVIKNRFMQMACKSAVKGGDDLSDLEIKTLLNTIKDSTEVLLCPHGRPIVVEITKQQIEKWFKRIV